MPTQHAIHQDSASNISQTSPNAHLHHKIHGYIILHDGLALVVCKSQSVESFRRGLEKRGPGWDMLIRLANLAAWNQVAIKFTRPHARRHSFDVKPTASGDSACRVGFSGRIRLFVSRSVF